MTKSNNGLLQPSPMAKQALTSPNASGNVQLSSKAGSTKNANHRALNSN